MHALQRVGSYRRSSNSTSNAPLSPRHIGTNSLVPPTLSITPTQNSTVGAPVTDSPQGQKPPPTLQMPAVGHTSREAEDQKVTVNSPNKFSLFA